MSPYEDVMMQTEEDMSNRGKTSSEVASIIGISRGTLIKFVGRNPELKPALRLPSGDFLWNDSEIELLVARRANRRAPGRAKQK